MTNTLKYVAAGIGQKDYINKQQERLKLVAKQLRPNLAAHIDAGGTVRDIADTYAYRKAQKLGVPVTTSTQDRDVMEAIDSGMSIYDFDRKLQSKPEWRTTPEANKMVDDYISTIGRMWGLA